MRRGCRGRASEAAARLGGGGAAREGARRRHWMRGGRGGGLGVPLPPELAFANSQVPSTLCNPAAHFSSRATPGTSRPLPFLLPLGPRRGFARPARAAQLHRRREARAAAPGATGSGGMRARRLAWRSRTCTLPSRLPPWGVPPCASPGEPSPGGGGMGLEWRLHTGEPSGSAGQVGAVLSAPTAQSPPQTLTSPPTSDGWLP